MSTRDNFGHRRSLRLKEYDYARDALYFVTICAHDGECLFGDVVAGEMHFNDAGAFAEACWRALPEHFPHITLDVWVVMPNHVHGIVGVKATPARARHASPLQRGVPLQGPAPGSLGTIVGSYKSAVSKRVNQSRATPGGTVWQRNYHEHLIRDNTALQRIREYIEANPASWAADDENPRLR